MLGTAEHILHSATGLQIICFEGLWGCLIMVCIAFPVLYVLPGRDRGHMESVRDSVAMVHSSALLAAAVAANLLSCTFVNMAAIAVTGVLSGLHRLMLGALRTLAVWVLGLWWHHGVDSSSPLGEAWTSFIWLEVRSFVVLVLGQTVFGGMLRVPGLQYPVPDAGENSAAAEVACDEPQLSDNEARDLLLQ